MKSLRALPLVVLCLLVQVELVAQAQQVAVTSEFGCGYQKSQGNAEVYKLSFASSVEGSVYKYEFTNHSTSQVRLLLLLSYKDHITFVGQFITDTDKPAEYRAGSGKIFIVLKPKEKKVFAVKDDSPDTMKLEVVAFLLDKDDSTFCGFPVGIYFPKWESVFGR